MEIQMVSNDNDLMKSLYSEDFATIKTLLAKGVDVNKPYNANGYKFVILFTKFVKRTNIRKNLVSKPNFYEEQ